MLWEPERKEWEETEVEEERDGRGIGENELLSAATDLLSVSPSSCLLVSPLCCII